MATLFPVYPNPRTTSQYWNVIDRLKRNDDALNTELVALGLDVAQVISDLAALDAVVTALGTDVDELQGAIFATGTATTNVTTGDALYASANGSVARAQANAEATSIVVGIALETVTSGNPVRYQVCGSVALTGVTFGVEYYLSADTAGALVSTPDAIAGEYIVPVGRARANAILVIAPGPLVLL
jgi:hypothetical protein